MYYRSPSGSALNGSRVGQLDHFRSAFISPRVGYKPVVDVARDAQCCVHTRDSSVADRHTDGQMDGQTMCDNKG